MTDQPTAIRPGEELDVAQLSAYLEQVLPEFKSIERVSQFPGGFSNLTYLLETNLGDWVLRRPPRGANIKSAHDMAREFRVLSQLQGIYGRIPQPVHLCENTEVLGAPFYLMERVNGLILRNQPPKRLLLTPEVMRTISEAAIDNLAMLHQIDIEATGLEGLGKPEGYVQRQVEGWTKRYLKAQTDDIEAMTEVAQWLADHRPADAYPGLIHNDYKYDNLVLSLHEPHSILAVLDWEMATVGDTRMDLGTTLAYWSEAQEAKVMKLAAGNLTWLPGNLVRSEVVERYVATTGHEVDNVVFYFAYGAFKIGVIVQQIYARWKNGLSKDPRFGGLLHAVRYFGELARLAIERDRISGLIP